jgi:SAM-dependent methyltransferase
MSLNYAYALDRAVSLSGTDRPTILDYGCGLGQIVELGLSRGVDIYGVDTFEGPYRNWHGELRPELRDRIQRMSHGGIPFEDETFDAVIANQVIEHIAAPLPVFREINRVLKRGGVFVALFPVAETWYEGHVELYFAHWLPPPLQRAYLRFCHRTGFGLHREMGPAWWEATLLEDAFYHRSATIDLWLKDAFGVPADSLAGDWMLARTNSLKRWPLTPLARHKAIRPLLEFACHVRAGRVLFARKPGLDDPQNVRQNHRRLQN